MLPLVPVLQPLRGLDGGEFLQTSYYIHHKTSYYIHHNCNLDDLGARLKVPKVVALRYAQSVERLPLVKLGYLEVTTKLKLCLANLIFRSKLSQTL